MTDPVFMENFDHTHWPIGIDNDGNGPINFSDPEWIEDICAKCGESWPCEFGE